jgi:hypothetical protein
MAEEDMVAAVDISEVAVDILEAGALTSVAATWEAWAAGCAWEAVVCTWEVWAECGWAECRAAPSAAEWVAWEEHGWEAWEEHASAGWPVGMRFEEAWEERGAAPLEGWAVLAAVRSSPITAALE